MPWEIPITLEDTTYPVRFNTEAEPTQADIDEAVAYLMQQRSAPAAPATDQPGRLGSFASSVGRGALSIIPGTIGGVGYLTGSDTLTEAADTIEGGINRMLPVNPEYQGEFKMKAGQAIGQALSMLGTGGVAGAAGKGLAISRGLEKAAAAAKGVKAAQNVMLGTGVLQGTRGGGQAAEQYGMQGGTAYARALLGGAIEGATERYLFGMGSELSPIGRMLGTGGTPAGAGLLRAVGTEAGEEAVAQVGGNLATTALAPYGIETPGAFAGAGEAAILGGIAGGVFGGVNALARPSPTIEGDAMVPFEQAPAASETEAQDELGVAAFQQEIAQIAQEPDPIEPLQQAVNKAAETSVAANVELLPATAAVIAAGGLTPAPAPAQTPIAPERNTDLFPDRTDFMGKLQQEAQLSTYEDQGDFGIAEYVNPDTGTVDVYVAAFGDTDYIAYIRQYDEAGKPTNTFTSKLERRSEAPGVTKKMLKSLQSRLPAQHQYTEDVSVSTDGLRFIASQLNQGYELARDAQGNPLTRDIAVSGESRVNDLPVAVDPNGAFENIRISDRKQFEAVRPVLGKILSRFGPEFGPQNVRWENGTVFIDIPVLQKKGTPVGAPVVEQPASGVLLPETTPAPANFNEYELQQIEQANRDAALKALESNSQTAAITVDGNGVTLQMGDRQRHPTQNTSLTATVTDGELTADERKEAKRISQEGSLAETPEERAENRADQRALVRRVFERVYGTVAEQPVVEVPETLDQIRARLRQRISAEERATMEQNLAQMEDEGVLADVFAEERQRAAQREDAARRLRELYAERARLEQEIAAQETPVGALVPEASGVLLPEDAAKAEVRKQPVKAQHITRAKFDTFDPNKSNDSYRAYYGKGFYFHPQGQTTDIEGFDLSNYGDIKMDVELNMEAPWVIKSTRLSQEEKADLFERVKGLGDEKLLNRLDDGYSFDRDMIKWYGPAKFTELLKKNGYDSVIYDAGTRGSEYVVFDAEQINTKPQSSEPTPIVEETVPPEQSVPAVEAAIEAQSSEEDNQKALLNDLQIAEADYRDAEQKAQDADELFFTERDKYDTRKNKPRNYTFVGPKEQQERLMALANDAFKARGFANAVAQDLGKARKNVASAPQTPPVKKSKTNAKPLLSRSERRALEEKEKAASTPEIVPNVEIVIDEPGAAEVGLGMEKAPKDDEMMPMPGVLPGGKGPKPPQANKAEYEKAVKLFEAEAPSVTLVDLQRLHSSVASGKTPQKAVELALSEDRAHQRAREAVDKAISDGSIQPGIQAQNLYDEVYTKAVEAKPAPPAKPAPEPTVQRDVTKPEQMTPEESYAAYTTAKNLAPNLADMPKTQKQIQEGIAIAENSGIKDSELQRMLMDSAKAETGQFAGPYIKAQRIRLIEEAMEAQKSVSKAAVDAYGITLPEGYVQDGELYVYRPSGTVEQMTPAYIQQVKKAQLPVIEDSASGIKTRFESATERELTSEQVFDIAVAITKEIHSKGGSANIQDILDSATPAQIKKQAPQPKPAAEVETPVAGVLARGKPRESIVFKKPVSTPLGDVIGYSWSSQLVEDVDKMGEPVLRRISNWEEAANNAETGRDIVHRFLIKKPDGTTSEVSLESTFGKMTDSDKKTLKSVVAAAKKLPFMRAELAELQDLQKQAEADYQRTQKLTPDSTKLELREPDAKWLSDKGSKGVYLEGVFLGYVESSELNAKGELANKAKFIFDNTWKWRDTKRKVRVTDTQKDRAKSLARSIKKAEDLLSRENVEVAKVTTGEQLTSLAEAGPPAAGVKPPSVTTDQPAPISTRPSLGSTGKQIIDAWRSLQGVQVAPGETAVGWDVNGGGTYAFINDKLVKLKRDNKGFESTYTDATDADWQDVSDALDRGALQVEFRKITGLGNHPKVDAGKTVKVLHQATGKPLQEFLATPEGAAYESRMQKAVAERGPKDFGSTNTVVTKETKDKAVKSLRKKIGGQTNVGLDPSILKDAIAIGAFYLEGGARSFAEFSAKMIEEFGAGVQKYIRPAYEALRKRTDIDTSGMDPEEGGETAPKAQEPKTPPPPAPKAEAPKEEPKQETPKPAPAVAAEPATVPIANDPVDAQRVALGLPPIMRQTQDAYTFPQMWADAESAMAANPKRGETLVDELNDKPRTISALEDAILLRERVNRVNALDLAMVEFNKAPKGNNETQRKAMDTAITELTKLDDALNVAGTEQGRSLNARKMLARQDYTLAKMITTLRAANDGDLSEDDVAMVTRLQKQIAEAQAKLAEVESGQAARLAEAEKVAFEAGRQEVLKDIQDRAKVEAEKIAEMRKRTADVQAAKKESAAKPNRWAEIREAANRRIQERQGKLYSDVLMLNAAATAADHVLIGATYIAEGVTKFADWVVSMRGNGISGSEEEMGQMFKESQAMFNGEELPAAEAPLKTKKAKAPVIERVKAIAEDEEQLDSRTVYNLVVEKMKARAEASQGAKLPEMSEADLTSVIREVTADVQQYFPDITEREVRDLFSGYGKILQPSQDELSKQIRQLSALGKLASAIEDAKAKIAPLKSGPQRDKATQAIRLQQKKLARELRMSGLEYAAGEGQLRSPLDAIKARLNNQINDLALEINQRQKIKKRPSVDYDRETEALVTLRDDLKRISDEVNKPAGPTLEETVAEEMKKIDKRILELQKLIAENKFKPKEDTLLHTAELDAKRDVRDGLNKTLAKLRKEAADKLRTQDDIDKDAIESAQESIAELEKKIAAKDVSRPQRRTPTETAEYQALIEKKKSLQQVLAKLRESIEGKRQMSDEQRIKAATKALDASIARMTGMITSGKFDVVKRTPKTPDTPELKAKREARNNLRKRILELRKLKRDAGIDPIAKQISTDKKRIQTRMKKLKERLDKGDFSKPVKKTRATDEELLKLQIEEEKLKEQWAKTVFERQLASRGPGKRLLDATQQTLNTSRAVLTSVDVSAVLRQGGFIVLGNPMRGFRNLAPMFKAFASDEFAKGEKFRLANRENYKNGLYQQSKLFLADTSRIDQMSKQEEAFMTRWLEKIPRALGGGILRGSQRAYTVFLNRLRADSFDAMVGNLKKGAEPTPEETKAVADYINIATGRGDLGKFNQAGTMLNTVFFAPRLVASRFQILAGYPYFTASGRTKALVLREYAKFLAGAAVVYALGSLAQDDDDEPIETDPRSSDFLKIRFGDTRVDPLSGLIQATVLLSRLASGEKKQASGKIVPIRGADVPYGADDSFDVMGNFVRTKFSPIVGSAVNVVTGKNVVGEPTDVTEELKRMVIPMSFNEARETLEAQGVPEATALIMLQLLGMGVQTYTPGKK